MKVEEIKTETIVYNCLFHYKKNFVFKQKPTCKQVFSAACSYNPRLKNDRI